MRASQLPPSKARGIPSPAGKTHLLSGYPTYRSDCLVLCVMLVSGAPHGSLGPATTFFQLLGSCVVQTEFCKRVQTLVPLLPGAKVQWPSAMCGWAKGSWIGRGYEAAWLRASAVGMSGAGLW